MLLILFVTNIFICNATEATPYNFLRYISGARSGGLSNTVVAMTDNIESVLYNPAQLATVETKNTSATFIKHVLDINSGMIAYKIPINEEIGHIGVAATYTNYGNFDYADEFGNLMGNNFGANDFNIAITYANNIDTNFYWGVSAKYIYVGIENAGSSALALDAGLLYKFSDRTNMGLSVLHAGYVVSQMNGYDASLPLDVRLGIGHRLKGLPLLLSFSLHHLADDYDGFWDRFNSFSIGGEFNFGQNVFARIGYDNQIRNLTKADSDKGLDGFSGGIGVKTNYINVDYGVNQYGAAALLHRISLEFNIK